MDDYDAEEDSFKRGAWVCDNTTGTERCGEIIELRGEVAVVSPDGTKENAWEVLEKSCYPG